MADVVIIGAGPTGCAAALAHAREGANVMLLESHPKAAMRFAGEWMHPPGARALARLGVDVERLSRAAGNGFVLFTPEQPPLELPYARGKSLARIHHELVFELRDVAAQDPRIDYRPGATFRALSDDGIEIVTDAELIRLRPERVIGADGRNSKVRAALGAPGGSTPISYMMGIEMKGARLPFEGLGHVLTGGPGPALLYRVDEDTIRGCLDVPVGLGGDARRKEAVLEEFVEVMPEGLGDAFRAAFSRATPWASTRFQPRTFFGRGSIWLAGDSVGHLHPVTGAGLTLGILDAVASAACKTLGEYEAMRTSYLVELLTNVLYHALERKDESARRIRSGLVTMLSTSPKDRLRTMRILTGEDEAPMSFVSSFAKSTTATLSSHPPPSLGDLREDLGWLKWPIGAALSQLTGPQALRAQSSFSSPFSSAPAFFGEQLRDFGTRLIGGERLSFLTRIIS